MKQIALLNILLMAAIYTPLQAEEEMAVDEADGLNFDSFHESKEGQVKLFDAEKGRFLGQGEPGNTRATKVYQQDDTPESTIEGIAAKTPAASADIDANDDVINKPAVDGLYEIRQRYSLQQHSELSPAHAANQLHRQMAKLCPQGWQKQREWSVPVDADFFLYYQFECL